MSPTVEAPATAPETIEPELLCTAFVALATRLFRSVSLKPNGPVRRKARNLS